MVATPTPGAGLFSTYQLDGVIYDEMFESSGAARPQCRGLFEDLLAASLPDLRRHQTQAEHAFLMQGITFTVYGDEQAPSGSSLTTCFRAWSRRPSGTCSSAG